MGVAFALAVGRRYGLIPVVWKNEDCNPKACFFINRKLLWNEKSNYESNKNYKTKYLSLSKNQLISNENSSNYYNKKFYQIFKKIS